MLKFVFFGLLIKFDRVDNTCFAKLRSYFGNDGFDLLPGSHSTLFHGFTLTLSRMVDNLRVSIKLFNNPSWFSTSGYVDLVESGGPAGFLILHDLQLHEFFQAIPATFAGIFGLTEEGL